MCTSTHTHPTPQVKLISEPWDIGAYMVGSFPNWDIWAEVRALGWAGGWVAHEPVGQQGAAQGPGMGAGAAAA